MMIETSESTAKLDAALAKVKAECDEERKRMGQAYA